MGIQVEDPDAVSPSQVLLKRRFQTFQTSVGTDKSKYTARQIAVGIVPSRFAPDADPLDTGFFDPVGNFGINLPFEPHESVSPVQPAHEGVGIHVQYGRQLTNRQGLVFNILPDSVYGGYGDTYGERLTVAVQDSTAARIDLFYDLALTVCTFP